MMFLRAALFITLLFSSAAYARPMTAQDVAKLRHVDGAAIAPDGTRIAFTTASCPDVLAGEDNGSVIKQLSLGWGPNISRNWLPKGINVSHVQFSPDGTSISFLHAIKGEKTAIWAVPVEGGPFRKLAALPDAAILAYQWSSNGEHVYFLAEAEADPKRIRDVELGFNAIIYEEEPRFNRLFAAKISAQVDTVPRELPVPGHVSEFAMAPNGRTIVVGSAPTPLVDDHYTSRRFHILDQSSGKILKVVATQGKLGDAEISPDGQLMSLIAATDKHDPAATTLMLVNLADGRMQSLNAGAPEAAVDAAWLADGRLAVAVHVGAGSRLRFYDQDGRIVEEVDPGPLVLRGLETTGDRIIVLADAPSHPVELFAYRSGTFERWTDHNPWLAEIDLGEQRTFRYMARDGQEIEGVLIEPVGGAPSGGAPTIMKIHGGPELHFSNGWTTSYSDPGQVAAGRGYTVFMPNYRGSTAYGTAFSKQHQGNYTDPEFNDLVDAKHALAAAGMTDPSRTGIVGGSYGGYAAGWAATALTKEFSAAVMFAGISNQVSKFGTVDTPWEMHNLHSRAWPWDNWQDLLVASPIYHTEKSNTPLLIVHGELDTRIAPSQSYELYRALKIRRPDLPLRMVLYPGEGHGLSRAAARLDYNLRMLRWFDTYLPAGNADGPLPPTRLSLGEQTD
ncbi:S9 family peptidase [Pacificimonas sp. WHA3]|uniref:S9 family peptidase n=1 Tax=Pacificimonas pallii TaxID=2827236 RepID=A0ABS6SAL5_9SPHN|nr:S9 family peptidase [Pacificimonas pallii]MBV7255321.1 S9 family peptidase [Pacificimonas pallii]